MKHLVPLGEDFLSPFRLLDEEFFRRPLQALPKMDMEEADGNIIVTADLPGMEKEDIDVKVKDGALVIRGVHTEEKEEDRKKKYYFKERTRREFYREIPLPTTVDKSSVHAKLQKGTLTVTLKKSSPEANEIGVKIES